MKEEKAGLKFLLIIAAKEVLDCEVNFCHSLDTGIRGIFLTKHKVTKDDIKLKILNDKLVLSWGGKA